MSQLNRECSDYEGISATYHHILNNIQGCQDSLQAHQQAQTRLLENIIGSSLEEANEETAATAYLAHKHNGRGGCSNFFFIFSAPSL